METIFTNIKERILYIAEYKGISKEKFFTELGVTYGNFKGKAKEKALSSDVLAKIVAKYPDINTYWLLNGIGEMLKNPKPITTLEKENKNTKEDISKRFNEAIKVIISKNPKIKKSEIAKSLNIGNSTLSEVLRRRMYVSIEILALLSINYDFSLDWLVNGSGAMLKSNFDPGTESRLYNPNYFTNKNKSLKEKPFAKPETDDPSKKEIILIEHTKILKEYNDLLKEKVNTLENKLEMYKESNLAAENSEKYIKEKSTH